MACPGDGDRHVSPARPVGRGRRGLNFGDCFAYQAAKEAGCALLFVGEDFSQTDIEAA